MISNTWPAILNSLTSIQSFVKHHATLASPHTTRLPAIHVIVEEIVVNIINHAYKDTDSGNITIELKTFRNTLTLSFSDTGPPFDPLATAPPDITKDVEERDIGGLGLFMVTQMADEIKYNRCNDKNILVVTMDMAWKK